MFLSHYATFLITSCSHNFEDYVRSILYRVSKKKKATGNSAISIADKKHWSDFWAPRWGTLQYVVFTQQQTEALQVKHYVALK